MIAFDAGMGWRWLGTISTSITLWHVSSRCLPRLPHSEQLWCDPGLALQVYSRSRAVSGRGFAVAIQAEKSQMKWKTGCPFLLGVPLFSNQQLSKATKDYFRLFSGVAFIYLFLFQDLGKREFF